MSGSFSKHANKSAPTQLPQRTIANSFILSASLQTDTVDCEAGAAALLSQQNTCGLSAPPTPPALNQLVFCLINFPQCLKSTSWTWKFHPENSESYYFTPRKGRKTSLSSPRKEKGHHYPSFLVFFCTEKTQLSTFPLYIYSSPPHTHVVFPNEDG